MLKHVKDTSFNYFKPSSHFSLEKRSYKRRLIRGLSEKHKSYKEISLKESMQLLSSRREVIRKVFTNPIYLLFALAITLVFYILNAFILQWKNLDLVTTQNVASFFTVGIYYLTTRISFYSLLLLSLLTGVLIALLLYRVKMVLAANQNRAGIVSSLGILAGILVPGCASCGIGLAAVLGLSASLSVLPFQGIEISIFAIMILIIAISMVVQSMTINAER